ncbi:hypothetical protein [Phenylobacterium sp.]|jgi:hypothetical protein|uniref:hypothetical protein n=1 Tax=Phenylobacterium sp. TaxID=1871053 RepID=UPI002F932B6A
MTNVIPLEDGYGGVVGDRSRMLGKPGSHTVYARGSDLVVEWYDFGDHAAYESANLLIFDRPTQLKLAQERGLEPELSPHLLANRVATHFHSYFEVKAFAEEHGLPFRIERDFEP